jgi:hypothetical protein
MERHVITQYPVQMPIKAGALVRGKIRWALKELGIKYTERKGLIESHMMVTIESRAQGKALQAFMDQLQQD